MKSGFAVADKQLADRYHESQEWGVRQVLAFAEPRLHSAGLHGGPLALARAIRPIGPKHQLEVVRAVAPLAARDVQIPAVKQLEGMVQRGASPDWDVPAAARGPQDHGAASTR